MKKISYKKVIEFDSKDLFGDFDGGTFPYFKLKPVIGTYPRTFKVDPFPCAKHDIKIIEKQVKIVESKFKIGAIVRYIILPNEIEGRSNAFASTDQIWNNDKLKEKYKFEGIVVLSGKRTIVHPVMSEYLIGHEYGHIVDRWITNKKNELLTNKDDQIFRKEYAEVRGIPYNDEYGGGRWVDNIAEVIADDFRIIITGTDVNFYKHTCTHPLKHKKIQQYWEELKDKYSI